MNRADIDIIVVNWNSGSLLRKCLHSVSVAAQAGGLGLKIIVVDNASRDGSAANLEFPHCPLVLLCNDRNVGFAAACNQGARAGVAEYMLFLNPDTEVGSDTLTAPWKFLKDPRHKKYGVCSVQLRNENGGISRSCARIPNALQLLCTSLGLAQVLPGLPLGIPMSDWDHGSDRDVDHVIGAFYLVRRELFISLGGFDERYFVYLEDLDLSLRIRNAGFKCRYLVGACAQHIGGGTSHQVKALRLFYSTDSRINYIRKHHAGITVSTLIPVILFVEPVVRIISAMVRLNGSLVSEVVRAYRMLWRKRLWAPIINDTTA